MEREKIGKMEIKVFYTLITEVPLYPFCHILFIRNKLLGQVTTQGEGITQVCDYWEVGAIESCGRLKNAHLKDIHVLIPGTSKCYLIWQNKSLCGCD